MDDYDKQIADLKSPELEITADTVPAQSLDRDKQIDCGDEIAVGADSAHCQNLSPAETDEPPLPEENFPEQKLKAEGIMNRRVHGATNIGFLCKDGIMLGNDTISSSDEKEEYIISDEEVKLFQLCCDPNIVCTLIGDVSQWFALFQHLLDKKPMSVQETIDHAEEYLKDYLRANRKNKNNIQLFGTIIAGNDDKGDLQLRGIETTFNQGRFEVRVHTTSLIVLGSGFQHVVKFFYDNSFDYQTTTKQEAANLVFGSLMNACFCDTSTGGNLKATLVLEGGYISDIYPVLKVYSELYHLCAEEENVIFIIYPTSISMIFGMKEIDDLISDILTNDMRSKRQFLYNMIAKKADFYVTRVCFLIEKQADDVYQSLRRNNPPCYPASLSHIKSFLVDCTRKKTSDHVYVGRSSKELVAGLEKLRKAVNLKY